MAIGKCLKCGKVVIGEARTAESKPCPFCGGPVRLQEAVLKPAAEPAPPAAEGIQAAGLGSRPPARVPTAAVPPSLDTSVPGPDQDEGKETTPKWRRRRRRRKRTRQGPLGRFGQVLAGVAVYLVGLGLVVFFWAALVASSLLGEQHGPLLIGYGVVVTFIGMVWLYIGAVLDMGLPASPFEFGGRGAVAALSLFIRLVMVVIYAVLYALMSPLEAWKPTLLTLVGIAIAVSGFVLQRV